jgi:hypothetical protein
VVRAHPTDADAVLVEVSPDAWAVVDAQDAELVRDYRWAVARGKARGWTTYAYSHVKGLAGGNRKTLKMHHLIAQAMGLDTERFQVDHRDRDGLNNRRSNLRTATRSQNGMNRVIPRAGLYRGAYLTRGRWQALIRMNRRRIHLGMFATAEEAARAYDKAARELHGEFAVLNFPDD